MNLRIRARLPIVLVVALVSCAPPKTWEHLAAPQVITEGNISISLPSGWVRAVRVKDGVILTKDGLSIQEIGIADHPKEKAFPGTKQTVPEGALPSDLAALQLAELRTMGGLANLAVLENAPAMVAGEPGFKLRVEWKNAQGARYRGQIYGALVRGRVLTLTYLSIAVHYFERNLPEFEQIVSSCKPSGS